MRPLVLTLLGCLLARGAHAQASVAADLWRVAEGTLVIPAALSDDGTAAFWTPAVALNGEHRYRIGIAAVHAPSEIGVSGGLAAFSARVHEQLTLSVTYGRLGIGSVGYTETSPEVLGSSAIDIYNQVASVGLAGRLASGVVAGVAVRYLSGRMGFDAADQLGLDVGAQYAPGPHLRFGVSTHFMDPAFAEPANAATYNFGAEVRSRAFQAWGTTATLALRLGVRSARADDQSQMMTAGLTLGPSFAIDYGAAYEQTNVDSVWRSRLGVGVTARQFTARIARDGGVHGFGATYRFSMTATFR